MDELRDRFRAADAVGAPDLWDEIRHRQPRHPSSPPRRARLLVAASAVLFVSAVTAAALVAGRNRAPERLAQAPPRANGRIAFLRLDPASALREGGPVGAELDTVAPDGSDLRRVAAGLPPRTSPAWSPDGTRIAFVSRGLVTADPQGDNQTVLVPCAPPACSGLGPPAWAPDGRRLAFWSDRDGRSGLWVGAGPEDLRLLKADLPVLGSPAWSPDGSEIAIVTQTGQILVLDAADGRERRRSPAGAAYGESLSWSADGRWIAAAADAPGGGVRVLPATLDGPPRLSLDSGHHPAWSPDGQLIVFTRALDEPGSDGFVGDLFVLEVASRRERPLTSGPWLDCCPSWQPVPSPRMR